MLFRSHEQYVSGGDQVDQQYHIPCRFKKAEIEKQLNQRVRRSDLMVVDDLLEILTVALHEIVGHCGNAPIEYAHHQIVEEHDACNQ